METKDDIRSQCTWMIERRSCVESTGIQCPRYADIVHHIPENLPKRVKQEDRKLCSSHFLDLQVILKSQAHKPFFGPNGQKGFIGVWVLVLAGLIGVAAFSGIMARKAATDDSVIDLQWTNLVVTHACIQQGCEGEAKQDAIEKMRRGD